MYGRMVYSVMQTGLKYEEQFPLVKNKNRHNRQWMYFGVRVAHLLSCWPPLWSENPVALFFNFSRADEGPRSRSRLSRSSWVLVAASTSDSALTVPLRRTSLGRLNDLLMSPFGLSSKGAST